MSIVEEMARLFEVPPAEFVKARNQLAAELRKAGKDEEAQRVASLRKPSTPLWVVNQLARKAPKDVEALIEATQGMRKGEDLREAMQAQREALRRLAGAAEQAASEIGAKMTPELQRRVQNTAQSAAAADPDQLREGTLEEELAPAGFEGLAGAKIPARRPPPEEEKKSPAETRRREREVRAAERTAQRLSTRAQKLEAAAQAAQERASAARKEADEAAARTLQLRRDQ